MKKLSGGDLRARIFIKKPEVKKSGSGFAKRDIDNAVNVFGEGVSVPCKWSDKPYNRSYKLSGTVDDVEASRDFVYALMNYSDKIGYDCVVFKSGEKVPYEIINISNIEERNRYTELQLRRVVQT